jgi:formate-dependent nitrite reductase cytochrome c552 subunit
MPKFDVQYIINEKGEKTAVVIPYKDWKKITSVLEYYNDICSYDKAKSKKSNSITIGEALDKLA